MKPQTDRVAVSTRGDAERIDVTGAVQQAQAGQ